MADYKLSYTASEINEKLGKIGQPVSWNDLTDKPFYDEGTKIITLDYSNLPTVSVDLMGDAIYKVTDYILTEADINGANISLSGAIGGLGTNFSQELNVDTATVVYPFTFGTLYQFDYEVNGTTVAVTIAVATQTGAFEEFGIPFTIPEIGTYIDYSFMSGEGTINSISLERDGELKTLEAKYLEIVDYAPSKILVNDRITFIHDANPDISDFWAELQGIQIIGNKQYMVGLNGEGHIVTAIKNEDNDGGSLAGMIVDTSEGRWLIANNPNGASLLILSPYHTEQSCSVYIKELEVYEIKQEYLPASLYTEIDQRIENYINEALGGEY